MSQGASNSGGQGAGKSFVSFSRPAAQRIAKAVRVIEAGSRSQPGVTFDHPVPSAVAKLKLATFTGNWQTGTYKTVTLQGSTNTASVYNWCNPAVGGDTASTTKTRFVIFGKVHGTNSVVEIQLKNTSETCVMTLGDMDMTAFPGYSAGALQLLGHSAADVTTNGTACASFTWYSITTCSTSTAA